MMRAQLDRLVADLQEAADRHHGDSMRPAGRAVAMGIAIAISMIKGAIEEHDENTKPQAPRGAGMKAN